MGGKRPTAVLFATLVVAVLAAPAHATYLGENGKIAFTRSGEGIWTVNPDGSGLAPLTGGDYPDWSPDGSKLAFGCPPPNSTHVCTANANGAGVNVLDNTDVHPQDVPTWSPDGTKLAIASGNDCGHNCFTSSIWRIDAADGADQIRLADGTEPSWGRVAGYLDGLVALERFQGFSVPPPGTNNPSDLWRVDPRNPNQLSQLTVHDGGTSPDWSPDGTKIVFASTRDGGNYEIYVMDADGSNETRLTTNTVSDYYPAWAPDGTKIVFTRVTGSNDYDLWTMNPDGTGEIQLTNTPTVFEYGAAWQPVPQPGYVRPKGATPLHMPLVPSFEPCDAPNRQHGPPLAFGSCAPPHQRGGFMTFGGAPAGTAPKAAGHVRFDVIVGTPGGQDDADVRISVRLTDVRRASDLADGPGSLDFPLPLRLTDKGNGAFNSESGTVEDFHVGLSGYINNPLRVEVPCVETADPNVGSTCSVTTTADVLVPGRPGEILPWVTEGRRALWQLDQLAVYDGGEDGYVESRDDNTVLAVQGIFVP